MVITHLLELESISDLRKLKGYFEVGLKAIETAMCVP